MSALLSCTAQNAAYSGSDGTGMPGVTSASTTSSDTSISTATTGPTSPQTTDDSHGPTSPEDETTASGLIDAGEETRCWLTPILIEDLLPAGSTLSNVPVRVTTSRLGPTFNAENLRFYQDGVLLPHELEEPGRIAWVRLREITGGADLELEAITGPDCRDVPDALQASEVWSAGYIAVFHFDDGAGVPLVFTDSVDGIALVADNNTDVAESSAFLGSYAQKSGNGALIASDGELDISGPQPLSILGWVRLEEEQAGVLPWDEDLEQARHRELLGKLPGYRLSAVRGQVSLLSELQPRPFFNLSQAIPGPLQDNIFGTAPIQQDEWTMLAGTYTGTDASLYVNGELASTLATEFIPGSDTDAELRVGRWLHGGVDEIRISNVARSAEWLRVQHASMTDMLLFYDRPEEL